MRLYYHPRSTCSRRVLITADHLGCPLELVPVDLFQGAQHAPEFASLNPNHKVPVLVDGSFVLWESYAIMQYLADMTPGQIMNGPLPLLRIQVEIRQSRRVEMLARVGDRQPHPWRDPGAEPLV